MSVGVTMRYNKKRKRWRIGAACGTVKLLRLNREAGTTYSL